MRLFYFLLLVLLCGTASAREKIRGIGSPLLFPIVSGVANEMNFSTFIEIGATGFSFQIFCSGSGDNYPDLVNSSRLISAKEEDLCTKNNIEFDRINLAYDAIVLVSANNSNIKNITDYDLFNAISAYVFDREGNLKTNNYRRWDEINPSLPSSKIVFYGTTLTSGTYDFLKEKILFPYCSKAKDGDPLKKSCGLARMDGRYIPVPGGYTMNIQKMSSRPGAVAIIPYLFLEKHRRKFSVISLNGIEPNDENIKSYLLSRMLYVYYKKSSLSAVPNFAEFIEELKSRSVK